GPTYVRPHALAVPGRETRKTVRVQRLAPDREEAGEREPLASHDLDHPGWGARPRGVGARPGDDVRPRRAPRRRDADSRRNEDDTPAREQRDVDAEPAPTRPPAARPADLPPPHG